MNPKKNYDTSRAFRASVRETIENNGYEFVPQHRFFASIVLEQPIFGQECEIGKDIFGKKRRAHFILYHPRRWTRNLVIQCKWQETRGSIEEKLPFEVESIAMIEIPTIIVLDGGGYSTHARQWLLNRRGKNSLHDVLSLDELQKFAIQGRL